ncbi:hypothetical protein SAMN02745121_06437 [Nannocystis exedens]|uniref:Uncharacterized protein n=1 Tax=Nannocystis exedens TaxID=54 RepID=A0A1I2F5I1_9BACT|nr:hypothetical protein [Nannocystis exedens]PCC73101.1 hypothetical protein NAEX_06187 [Nannocystis exedens]SFF00229.1 hypothetical protein SAMN02745121_06437 [Nannocystis exedens]
MDPKNRRRHRVFATKHTEYHLRADECVGVRDRTTGAWLRRHAALRLRAVQLPPIGADAEWIGRRLQFWGYATDVTTSPVTEVMRPELHALAHYVSGVRSGEIAA